MAERPFFIHWNELSLGNNLDEIQLNQMQNLTLRISSAFEALLAVLKIRSDCRLLMQHGTLNALVMGRPFRNLMEDVLGKDGFRRLRSTISQPEISVEDPASHDLECEISCSSLRGEGLTRAYLASSWVWSFGSAEGQCAAHVINAEMISIDNAEIIKVEVPNLATVEHSKYWSSELEAWGRWVSSSSIITTVEGYNFIMYPSDHWPPHLHVRLLSIPGLNMKYRIDKFEVLNDDKPRPLGLDNLAEVWIEKNKTNLLVSWERCKRGQMPLKIS